MYPIINRIETGRMIQKYMQILHLTAKDLQDYLGLTCVQSVYHWINGRCLPTLENLYAMSELFGVPMDVLIVGTRKVHFFQVTGIKYGRLYEYFTRLANIA